MGMGKGAWPMANGEVNATPSWFWIGDPQGNVERPAGVAMPAPPVLKTAFMSAG